MSIPDGQFKKMVMDSAQEFEEVRAQTENPVEAYHHANYLLSELLVVVSEYLNDNDVRGAIEQVIEGYEEIAERAGIDFSSYEEI
jgi:hypothetical protein